MSVFSETTYTVDLMLAPPYNFLVDHVIFDQDNIPQVGEQFDNEGYHSFRYRLSGGLYTFRVIINGMIKDEFIIVDRPLCFGLGLSNPQDTKKIVLPELYSSIPLRGKRYGMYGSSTSYYMEAMSTTIPISSNNDSSTFSLLLRYASSEVYTNKFKKQKLWSSFSLFDQNLNYLMRVKPGENALVNEEEGWMAAEIPLPTGLSFLLYESAEHSRLVPLQLNTNQHLHVFMTLAEEPKFGTLRMFSLQERHFPNNDPEILLLDLLLDKLNNQDYSKSDEVLEYVQQKTSNSLLNLIATYLYIGSLEKNYDNTLLSSKILGWINYQKSYSEYQSDIDALKIKLIEKGYLSSETIEMDSEKPPIIRAGFEALLRSSIKTPEILKSFTLLDYIGENLMSDSPYTTFTAPEGLLKKQFLINFTRCRNFKLVNKETHPETFLNSRIVDLLGKKNINRIRRDLILNRKGIPWVIYEINEILEKEPDINIDDAAQKLKLPKATLIRTLKTERDFVQGSARFKTIRILVSRASIFLIIILGPYAWYKTANNVQSGIGEDYVSTDLPPVMTWDSLAVQIPDWEFSNTEENTLVIPEFDTINKIFKYNDFIKTENTEYQQAYIIMRSYIKSTNYNNKIELNLPDSILQRIHKDLMTDYASFHPYMVALEHLKNKEPQLIISAKTNDLLILYEQLKGSANDIDIH